MRRTILLSVVAIAACDDATPRTLLDGPRVLAIVAEPPVLAPDTSAELTAIVALDGVPAAPDRIVWRACSPWTVVTDPVRDCTDALELPTGADGRAVVDARAVAERFEITTPPAVPGGCAAAWPALTVVAELELTGIRLIARKQIAIAAVADRTNPVFVQARVDGETLATTTTLPGGKTVVLGADLAVDSLDTVCEIDGRTRPEDVRVVVYPGGGATASDESFDIVDRDGVVTAGSVELELPDAPATVPLWLVAVDETGGAAAMYSSITIR